MPAIIATLVLTAAVGFAMRPALADSWLFWAGLAAPYAALSAWTLHRFRARQLLADRLKPRGGDVSMGILLGLVMVTIGFISTGLLAPFGSPRGEWLARLYIQVGDVHGSFLKIAMVALIATMEELVWRGLVLESLEERFGWKGAVLLSAVAYALAHSPTLFTLASDNAGLNPLLVVASFGCGLVWSFGALYLSRLWPLIISHVVFSHFLAAPVPSWFSLTG